MCSQPIGFTQNLKAKADIFLLWETLALNPFVSEENASL
jgi:hypothetical protein